MRSGNAAVPHACLLFSYIFYLAVQIGFVVVVTLTLCGRHGLFGFLMELSVTCCRFAACYFCRSVNA